MKLNAATQHLSREEIANRRAIIFYIYSDMAGNWQRRLYAFNNRIIADSREIYHNEIECLYAIQLVKSSTNAPIHEL